MSEAPEYTREALAMLGMAIPDQDWDEDRFTVQFLAWETAQHKVVKFGTIYVDMADGDVLAGLLLSQIVFWHLPNKDGDSKLRVFKNGHYWIARGQEEWWDEVRLSKKQVARCLEALGAIGLIECDNFRFNGKHTNHIRIIWKQFVELWRFHLPKVTKGNFGRSPKVTLESDQRELCLTETTTETTKENNSDAVASGLLSLPAGEDISTRRGQAGEMPIAPQVVHVPHSSKKGMADGYSERCRLCGDRLTQELDECPGCHRSVEWKNSRPAEKRKKRQERDATAAKAQALRGNAQRLSDATAYVLGIAIATAGVNPGDVTYNKDEETRLLGYEQAYGADLVRGKADEFKANEEGGRGLIVHLLNYLRNHNPKSSAEADGGRFDFSD